MQRLLYYTRLALYDVSMYHVDTDIRTHMCMCLYGCACINIYIYIERESERGS